jgi:hypothetical protein
LAIDTNRALDELAALLVTRLGAYVDAVGGLAPLAGIHVTSGYADAGREKPYVAIFPTEARLSDSGQRMSEKRLVVDVSVFVAGNDELDNARDMVSYADCIESVFLDCKETETVFDIEVQGTEYYSRASTMEKMASIMIECTTRSCAW